MFLKIGEKMNKKDRNYDLYAQKALKSLPHTFRAYAITRLVELGYHPNDIKSVSGHSGIAMVDYYNKHEGNIKDLTKLLIGD